MLNNKKGVTLVELMMVIAIGGVLLTGAGFAGWNVYQNSIDNGIREDLQSLSNATTAFMTDTNGVAPCFSPTAAEGVAPAAGTYCAGLGYDYTQGRIADTLDAKTVPAKAINLDYDSKGSEIFTFNNILVPTYMEKLPNARRAGQVYMYTKGVSTSTEGNQSFAYSALLSGPKAQDTLNDNISIFNVSGVGTFANSVLAPACTQSSLNAGSAAQVGAALATTGVTGYQSDVTKVYRYLGYLTLTGATGIATNPCDLFSDGEGIRTGNFTNALTSITVNLQ